MSCHAKGEATSKVGKRRPQQESSQAIAATLFPSNDAITTFVTNAMGQWSERSSMLDTWKIKRAVNGRFVLSERRDQHYHASSSSSGQHDHHQHQNSSYPPINPGKGHDRHQLEYYAMSPVLHTLKYHCLMKPSRVFVVYAPKGMGGKTTACYAVMTKYARRGLAFAYESRTLSCFTTDERQRPYKDMMLRRLGFDVKHPPEGWLGKLLDELEAPTRHHDRPAVLMLDDFMNHCDQDRGNIPNVKHNACFDEALLLCIAARIQTKNIVVIVLTRNEKAANQMITWNDMQSITPATSEANIGYLRLKYASFVAARSAAYQRTKMKPKAVFQIDWNHYLPLKWQTKELKAAILEAPEHLTKSRGERRSVRASIDDKLWGMWPQKRDKLQPGEFWGDHSSVLGGDEVDDDNDNPSSRIISEQAGGIPTLPSSSSASSSWGMIEAHAASGCTRPRRSKCRVSAIGTETNGVCAIS